MGIFWAHLGTNIANVKVLSPGKSKKIKEVRDMAKVKDIMSVNIVTIDGSANVSEAIEKMLKANVRGLIVERRDEGDAYGVVTLRDIVGKVIAEGLDPKNVAVHEIMTKPLVSLNPNLDVKYAARLLARLNISRAPVIAEHRLMGIVTLADFMKLFK